MTGATHLGETAGATAEEQIRALLDRTIAMLASPPQYKLGEAKPLATEAAAREAQHRRLAHLFSLSDFEAGILVLCLAAELFPETGELCAVAHNDARLRFPTFQLALRTIAGAHWSATLPQSPLRRWHLIEVGAGDPLLTAPLALAEPVLHFLMSAPALDERLLPLLEPVAPPEVLPFGYRAQAEKLLVLLAEAKEQAVVAHLSGTATRGKHAVAAIASASLGLRLFALDAAQIPAALKDRELVQHMIERDAALLGFALLVDLKHASTAEATAAAQLADSFAGVALLCGEGVPALRHSRLERIAIDRPDPASQQALWNFALGEAATRCNGHVERVATQFSFDYEQILRTGEAVRRQVDCSGDTGAAAGEQLLASCRAGAPGALDVLAQRIEPRAGWQDIMLPEASLEALRAIAAQVRQQGKVLERRGFAAQTTRGLGISALFHGPSGTGKTLAAEVLALDLGLDLWRIDLSQMVSKYIGETEKNLAAIFDAAENTGSILLFDEADALFGRRSEVRDSHDRYANIEVSYLLQRIEAYRGLAILTSNLRANLDTAFMRRITFFVSFPFPDQNLRRCIWEHIFPSAMPAENLDYGKLARLNFAGGNIRNIALNAAYIAADLDQPVRMEHLLAAARRECAKIDRPLTATKAAGEDRDEQRHPCGRGPRGSGKSCALRREPRAFAAAAAHMCLRRPGRDLQKEGSATRTAAQGGPRRSGSPGRGPTRPVSARCPRPGCGIRACARSGGCAGNG